MDKFFKFLWYTDWTFVVVITMTIFSITLMVNLFLLSSHRGLFWPKNGQSHELVCSTLKDHTKRCESDEIVCLRFDGDDTANCYPKAGWPK